jgi:hypothetical protein
MKTLNWLINEVEVDYQELIDEGLMDTFGEFLDVEGHHRVIYQWRDAVNEGGYTLTSEEVEALNKELDELDAWWNERDVKGRLLTA